MADKVRFYIVDTPFGYIVSTKRIVLKLKDNNEGRIVEKLCTLSGIMATPAKIENKWKTDQN